MGLLDFFKSSEFDEEGVDRHLQSTWYGDFELTDAIRPFFDGEVKAEEG